MGVLTSPSSITSPAVRSEENVRPSDDPSNVAVPMDLDDADSTGEHDGLEHGEGWPSPLSPEGLQRLQSQQQRILLMYQDGKISCFERRLMRGYVSCLWM